MLLPGDDDRFAASLHGAGVELLDGGHLLAYEHPEQVSKLVNEFVMSAGRH
ncbi:MAG: hypothetical protein J2O47_06490 [Acidimicrobiaceae bacterium]|nr:hypothetical protein [Acidimicrobiaceae bacterium]